MKFNMKYGFILLIIPALFFVSSCSTVNIPMGYYLGDNNPNGVVIVKLLKTGATLNGAYVNLTTANKKFLYNLNFVSEKKNEYYAIEMPKGEYKFCDARFHGFIPTKHRCRVDIDFKIEPGLVTYAGVLEIDIENDSSGLTWDVNHNKTLEADFAKVIISDFPNLNVCEFKDLNGNSFASYQGNRICF